MIDYGKIKISTTIKHGKKLNTETEHNIKKSLEKTNTRHVNLIRSQYTLHL